MTGEAFETAYKGMEQRALRLGERVKELERAFREAQELGRKAADIGERLAGLLREASSFVAEAATAGNGHAKELAADIIEALKAGGHDARKT